MSKEERFEYIQDTYHLFMAWIFDYKTDKEYNTNNKNDMEDMIKLLNGQDAKITDLEAKLAEYEKEIKALKSKEKKIQLHTKRDWFERCCLLENKSISLGFENSELKQQLAKKDKEIEKLTEELDDKNFCKDFVDLYTENKLKTQMLHENWKDKISFAVKHLEKVLNLVDGRTYVAQYLKDQIKQLKEKSNDKQRKIKRIN